MLPSPLYPVSQSALAYPSSWPGGLKSGVGEKLSRGKAVPQFMCSSKEISHCHDTIASCASLDA